jgi:hypothetical protein
MTQRRTATVTATATRPPANPLQQESRMTDSNARLAELEARMNQLETQPNLRDRGRGLMSRLMPPDASRHFRNAGREQLLGIRSIVDFWIRRIDESEDRPAPRRESIEIE